MEAEIAMPGTASGMSRRRGGQGRHEPGGKSDDQIDQPRRGTREHLRVGAQVDIDRNDGGDPDRDNEHNRHADQRKPEGRDRPPGPADAAASAVPSMGDMSGATSMAPIMVVAESAAMPAVAITVAMTSLKKNDEYWRSGSSIVTNPERSALATMDGSSSPTEQHLAQPCHSTNPRSTKAAQSPSSACAAATACPPQRRDAP